MSHLVQRNRSEDRDRRVPEVPRRKWSWNAYLTFATVLCPIIIGLAIGWWLKKP